MMSWSIPKCFVGNVISMELQFIKVTSGGKPLDQFSVQLLWHHSPPLFFVIPSSAASRSLNPTSYDQATDSHNYVLSLLLRLGLVKRNHLHHQYQVPFALFLFSMQHHPSYPFCQLVAARHQNKTYEI
ncbi:unnamed protein product [Protopolystoma xenopodis]|uniref:Uncharacterized protein n=1 Tax=Protopolystoma xenopodis TaxID=117903 RepID=A0A3S5FFP3_9PLAT|nr:unnamed protein product [Protopolystoma xenopodis]